MDTKAIVAQLQKELGTTLTNEDLQKIVSIMNTEAAAASTFAAPAPKISKKKTYFNGNHIRQRWVERMWLHVPPMQNRLMKDFIETNRKQIDEEIDACFEDAVYVCTMDFTTTLKKKTKRSYYINIAKLTLIITDETENNKVTTYKLKRNVPEGTAKMLVSGTIDKITSLQEHITMYHKDRGASLKEQEDHLKWLQGEKEKIEFFIKSYQERLETLPEEIAKADEKLKQMRKSSPDFKGMYREMDDLLHYLIDERF